MIFLIITRSRSKVFIGYIINLLNKLLQFAKKKQFWPYCNAQKTKAKKKKRIAHFYLRNSEKLNQSQVLDSLRSVGQFLVYVCHKSIKGERERVWQKSSSYLCWNFIRHSAWKFKQGFKGVMFKKPDNHSFLRETRPRKESSFPFYKSVIRVKVGDWY